MVEHQSIEIQPQGESNVTTWGEVRSRIDALLEGESDWVAAMATVVCELHHTFDHFHWTGFYRTVRPNHLKIGPYQGGHGCLDIPFDRGICGAAASSGRTQDVPDVHARPEHIACSSTTNSEVVVPVIAPNGTVIAVLDVLHYMPPEEQDATLNRLVDALAPGGTLLIRDGESGAGWRSTVTSLSLISNALTVTRCTGFSSLCPSLEPM